MAAIKISESLAGKQKLVLDGTFVTEYLPSAPEMFVKVYLTGLYLALTGDGSGESVALKLFTDVKTVDAAFLYWQEQGLVHISESHEIEYLPVVSRARQIRKFSKEKYRTFNDQLHALFPTRNILPAEYNEYYTVMETCNIEIEAMLTIIGYCKRLKGDDITYPYIVAVARNFAAEGCVTFDRVNEKIGELDLCGNELRAVTKALGKKNVDHEDKRLYNKWTKSLGFTHGTVVEVAKRIKKGGIGKLDAKLTKYYELHLFTVAEIEHYEKTREELLELTKRINRIIGVYYEQLDYFIETYTMNWLQMGFEPDTLEKIAEYCFKHGLRTPEAMNDTLKKFYKIGCISGVSIAQFVSDAAKSDEEIKEIFEALGVGRPVSSRDRDYYRTWTYSWKMPREVILYGAELSKKADSPLSYLNSVLAAWHDKGITTKAEAEKAGASAPAASVPSTGRVVTDFSADELNAAFDKLNESDL